MIIVVGVVSILMIVGGIFIFEYTGEEVISPILVFFGLIILTGAIVSALVFGCILVGGRSIDVKIELYENDNESVYNEISIIATTYCGNDGKLTELLEQKADPSTITAVFPSLRSSELYMKQAEIYNANRTKIRELQEDKIGLKEYRWWLYFGK